LVMPIGESDQHLMLSRRTPDGILRFKLEPVRFVPLVPGPG
jgi:protein-L-isoaspartate(D-aspartate) O-methyltransferase